MVGTGSVSALLSPNLRKVYIETGKERPREYPLFFNIDDMPWNPVSDFQTSGLGTMPSKPQGSNFPQDEGIMGGTKTYQAQPYGLAFEATWEAWRDELYGYLEEMTKELARAGRNREEVQAWSVLNNAFSTSFPGFTSGEALCSTSHAKLDGNTYANRPSPDIGVSITGIQNAIIRFENMTDDRGLPRLMTPTMLIVGPTNKFICREILGSSGKPFTTDNELNAIVEDDLSWMVCHYFTTTTQWFMTAAKGQHDMNFLWRDHPIFDSYDDPATKNAVFTAYQRHTEGYGTPRGIDGSTG